MANSNPQNTPLTQDPEIQQCFRSLPAYIQETIHQSGVTITSKQQLQQCADHLMKK